MICSDTVSQQAIVPCQSPTLNRLLNHSYFRPSIGTWLCIVMVSSLSLFVMNSSSADAKISDFTKAAKRAMPAVVSIQVIKRSQLPKVSGFEEEFLKHFFGPSFPPNQGKRHPQRRRRGGEQQGQGSGFIMSDDGYILTNNHVVGGADEIIVQMADGRSLKAKLVGADDKSDVAVIKVNEHNLPTLKIGDSSDLEIGAWVMAVGNPFGLSATLTVGVVSATGRAGMGITDYEEFIQTDAAINPGNSGGPLLNIDGEVVGINTAIYSRSGGYMGIGFAIPINMALKIKKQLITYGKVRRGRIGAYIQELTPEVATQLGLDHHQGVLIADIVPNSPAAKAKLKAGDIVTKLNDAQLTSAAMFRNRISLTTPNSYVSLTVIRRGKTKQLKIKIDALDRGNKTSKKTSKRSEVIDSEYGLEVQDITRDIQEKLNLKNRGGVLISYVAQSSIAEDAGLKAGQVILSVNQRNVESVRHFKTIVSKSKSSLLLHVKDRQSVRFIVLKKKMN
jgi:serine protease Do